MLRIAAVIALLAGPAFAQMPADIEKPLLDILAQYGKHVGSLSACKRGPGKSAIRGQAEKVGDWKYPGWWAGISGKRSDYVDEIARHAEFEYSLSALGGCTGAGSMAANLLLGEIETAIDRYTK